MSVLVVVAHPDDEVLGAGGTLAMFQKELGPARACLIVADADARTRRPRSSQLQSDIASASEILGLESPILGDFPNIRLNTVPHLELVQFIEEAIGATDATTIFTHHPGDLNNDHQIVSLACQAAARITQRQNNALALEALYFMEILSSTDWSFRGGAPAFEADTYFEIGEDGLDRKLKGLNAYRGVMRAIPHSRSKENVRALATYRGAQAGVQYAEAFQTAFRRVSRSPALCER